MTHDELQAERRKFWSQSLTSLMSMMSQAPALEKADLALAEFDKRFPMPGPLTPLSEFWIRGYEVFFVPMEGATHVKEIDPNYMPKPCNKTYPKGALTLSCQFGEGHTCPCGPLPVKKDPSLMTPGAFRCVEYFQDGSFKRKRCELDEGHLGKCDEIPF